MDGRFQKLCRNATFLGKEGTRVGPELTGAGKNGIRYFLENIINPNADGTDFQMTIRDARRVSELVHPQDTITLRTTAGETVIAKADIAQHTQSEKSLMPKVRSILSEREQIEYFKFLTSN